MATLGERGVGEKESAQQRDCDADRADQQIFPGGLDRSLCLVEIDERSGAERGRLNGNPHQPQVMRAGDECGHRQKEHQTRHEDSI